MPTTLTNLSWKFAERIASQLVSFVVSIILARILTPSDYGSVAMVMIFVTLANVLVEGGFSSALIQKKMPINLILARFFILASFFPYFFMWHFFLVLHIFQSFMVKGMKY